MISELSATYQFGGGYECGITSLAQNDRPTTTTTTTTSTRGSAEGHQV